MARIVFHIDVNSAFLSWTAVKLVREGQPDIRLVPSVVSGDPDDRRSIIAAASIPAKKLGIRSAQPVSMALRKYPQLVIDETRDRIMPANHGRGINELMKACNEYFQMTGRRISFEYAMIRGVNDSEKHAELLAQRAKEVGAHVNLIPLNHVDERNLTATSDRVIHAFKDKLEEEHVNVTIRRKLGSDIEASCGQLRRNTIRETHSQS